MGHDTMAVWVDDERRAPAHVLYVDGTRAWRGTGRERSPGSLGDEDFCADGGGSGTGPTEAAPIVKYDNRAGKKGYSSRAVKTFLKTREKREQNGNGLAKSGGPGWSERLALVSTSCTGCGLDTM